MEIRRREGAAVDAVKVQEQEDLYVESRLLRHGPVNAYTRDAFFHTTSPTTATAPAAVQIPGCIVVANLLLVLFVAARGAAIVVEGRSRDPGGSEQLQGEGHVRRDGHGDDEEGVRGDDAVGSRQGHDDGGGAGG